MLSRVHILNFNWFWGAFRASKKCSFEVEDPPEARTWAIVFLNDFNSILMGLGDFGGSKKCNFEVDDPPEARTWEIVFFKTILREVAFCCLSVNQCEPEPF